VADGLFDVHPVGTGPQGAWPGPGAATLPGGPEPAVVLLAAGDSGARDLARAAAPGATQVEVGAAGPGPGLRLWTGPPGGDDPGAVGLHVAVHPLAAAQPHNGIGFGDYLLVLTDRAGRPSDPSPTAAVAWLSAARPGDHVVVVEGGEAEVWRGRARRGRIGVDTRTDLWRLVAHARVVVDLAPGTLVARECVETQRYGIPLVAPAGTLGAAHATAGGGAAFAGAAGLLAAVEAAGTPGSRPGRSARARAYAEAAYGDPAAFVDRVGRVLATARAA
jgi:hypothetical protein